jgi:hypothetical protein
VTPLVDTGPAVAEPATPGEGGESAEEGAPQMAALFAQTGDAAPVAEEDPVVIDTPEEKLAERFVGEEEIGKDKDLKLRPKRGMRKDTGRPK